MLAGSVYYASDREKRKVFEGGLAEKKAKEKNEAWIRELEARDREDREEREEERRRREREKARRKAEVTEGGKKEVGIDKGVVAKCVVEREEERGWGIVDAVRRLRGRH